MNILDDVLYKEKQRNIKMQEQYNQLVSNMPLGCVIIKKIGNNEYCYLHYKENGKTKNKYYGDISKYQDLKNEIDKRKHYEKMLNILKKEYVRIERMEKIK